MCAELEATIRRALPDTASDASPWGLHLLVHLTADAEANEIAVLRGCAEKARVSLGVSEPATRPTAGPAAWRQAFDANKVAASLRPEGGALAYSDLGAYKYLAQIAPGDEPDDRLFEAIRKLEDYDRRRRSALVTTLEAHLHDGRSQAATARSLTLHPNTVRQRLQRIGAITGLDVAAEDPLELELAIKLRWLQASSGASGGRSSAAQSGSAP